MPHEDEVRIKLVALWIDKAGQDLRAAQVLMQYKPPLLYPACFHCQQASEKYIKAFLTYWQVEFSKTHNVADLLELAATVDDKLAEELIPAAVLTPYRVEVRYPGDLPEPSQAESIEALALAHQVAEAIMSRVKMD